MMIRMPVKSEVLTQPFLDFLAEQFQLDPLGIHGIEHWLRVLITGRKIAQRISANLKVIELFALVHDSRRWNAMNDPLHGQRAAEFCENLNNRWFKAQEYDLRLLRTACRYHSSGNLHPNLTVQACWDADRLDLGRVGKHPKKTYLGSRLARDENFMKMAYERSVTRFVIEDFNYE